MVSHSDFGCGDFPMYIGLNTFAVTPRLVKVTEPVEEPVALDDETETAAKWLCELLTAEREIKEEEERSDSSSLEDDSSVSPRRAIDCYATPERVKSPKRKRDEPKKQQNGVLPSWQTNILKKWFLAHADTAMGPYPTEDEKLELSDDTARLQGNGVPRLSVKQIETWFSNNRRSTRKLWSKQARARHIELKRRKRM